MDSFPAHHAFTIEQLKRSIEQETSVTALHQICHILLGAWITERNMTKLMIQQSLPRPNHAQH